MESPARSLIRFNYTVATQVKRVWERIEKVHLHGAGLEAVFQDQSFGWYVAFDGSYEALYFGPTKPDFNVGDKIKISFERIRD